MDIRPPSERALLWISLVAEVAIGPIFLAIGYSIGLIYAPAAIFYILCCAVVVPLFPHLAGLHE